MESNPYAKKYDWQDSKSGQADLADPESTFERDESMAESDTQAHKILADYGDSNESDDQAQGRSTFSVLGPSLVFRGELSAEEDLLIQGRVEGSIKHRATNLTIGAHGDVRADIVARRVIVQGKVVGDIRASESVIVEPSANVRGDIFAPRVGLREGAQFKGQIDMESGAGAQKSAPSFDDPETENKRQGQGKSRRSSK